MHYLFTSESVSEGHPDKIADQIADNILDHFLAFDPESKVAAEVLVSSGQVIISGEVRSEAYVDLKKITRETIKKIGYNKSAYKFEAESCGILTSINEQSGDIYRGLKAKKNQGAGDQGIIFGYANSETKAYIPLPLYLSHLIIKELSLLRKEHDEILYLRPDAKAQVTVAYDQQNNPLSINTIVISTQHDEFDSEKRMSERIESDMKNIVMERIKKKHASDLAHFFHPDIIYHINPTGKFVIGGPYADTGLTGRKIIVDTYGGKGAHGGGAFSGKDPSKVDRSAAYAARHVAKNLVGAGVAKEILVQISYAIGIAKPCSIFVNSFGTHKANLSDKKIVQFIENEIDLSPFGIIEGLSLKKPIYYQTAVGGHMGRESSKIIKKFESANGVTKSIPCELFTWENLTLQSLIKNNLK